MGVFSTFLPKQPQLKALSGAEDDPFHPEPRWFMHWLDI